jgi:hypothetical protein
MPESYWDSRVGGTFIFHTLGESSIKAILQCAHADAFQLRDAIVLDGEVETHVGEVGIMRSQVDFWQVV